MTTPDKTQNENFSARPQISCPDAGHPAIPDDLRPWVVATAPTLTAEQWAWLHACSWRGMNDHIMTGNIAEDSRRRIALLAYPREIAAGLNYDERSCFDYCDEAPNGRHARLEALGLFRCSSDGIKRTPLGHEVARVLAGGEA